MHHVNQGLELKEGVLNHRPPSRILLTTLSLDTDGPWLALLPTIHQLLSILVTNPDRQEASMTGFVIPKCDSDGSAFQVPLRHLKRLHLTGELRCL